MRGWYSTGFGHDNAFSIWEVLEPASCEVGCMERQLHAWLRIWPSLCFSKLSLCPCKGPTEPEQKGWSQATGKEIQTTEAL